MQLSKVLLGGLVLGLSLTACGVDDADNSATGGVAAGGHAAGGAHAQPDATTGGTPAPVGGAAAGGAAAGGTPAGGAAAGGAAAGGAASGGAAAGGAAAGGAAPLMCPADSMDPVPEAAVGAPDKCYVQCGRLADCATAESPDLCPCYGPDERERLYVGCVETCGPGGMAFVADLAAGKATCEELVPFISTLNASFKAGCVGE
jgi:hypothetical protein